MPRTLSPSPVALFVLALALTLPTLPEAAHPIQEPVPAPVVAEAPSPPAPALDPLDQWGAWRGPLATGEAPHGDPPTSWSEERNVRWRAELPGQGHSTPVVWGERVFLTTAVPFGEELPPVPDVAPGAHDNARLTRRHRFVVLAVNLASGEVVWERAVREALPHENYHVTGSLASASPVTDGKLLYASFGSQGVYCLTLDGELVWERDLGDLRVKHAHGEGSSPALHDGTLVVAWDHEGDSFLVALNGETGEELWRAAREEPTSWATPIVVEHEGKAQVVVSGTNRLRGYDLATGKSIWECGGLSHNVVASPVAAGGLVVAGSSYEKQSILAIRLDGAVGDLTVSDRLAWMRRRRAPYVPSPLLVDGALYFLHHYQGTLSRVELETGAEPTGPFRLEGIGNVYASPVAAAGRVYVTDLSGATLVLSHAAQPELLAYNQLDDSFSASAAIAGDALLLRGSGHLYCLADD